MSDTQKITSKEEVISYIDDIDSQYTSGSKPQYVKTKAGGSQVTEYIDVRSRLSLIETLEEISLLKYRIAAIERASEELKGTN